MSHCYVWLTGINIICILTRTAAVSFYSHTFVLVGVSVMLAVLTIVLTRTPTIYGPPDWICNLLVGQPGTLLGLAHLIPGVMQ